MQKLTLVLLLILFSISAHARPLDKASNADKTLYLCLVEHGILSPIEDSFATAGETTLSVLPANRADSLATAIDAELVRTYGAKRKTSLKEAALNLAQASTSVSAMADAVQNNYDLN